MKLINVVCVFVMALTTSLTAVAHHNSQHSIEERLKPVGTIKIAGEASSAAATTQTAAVASGPREGSVIYQKHCFACHMTGAAGAPKLEAAAWTERKAKGVDALISSVINGKGAMPPKGTCMDCTDEEFKNTVQYMLDQAK